MEENINYAKLINLMNGKEYNNALKEISSLQKRSSSPFQLILIKLFCLIETEKIRSAKISVNKLLKDQPEHQLLQSVSTYLNNAHSMKNRTNPLSEFTTAFLKFNQSEISKSDEKQFNKLLDQILVKPSIK